MSIICGICQNISKQVKNVFTAKIGNPAITIKDLLEQCLEVDVLPNGIAKSSKSYLCSKCEIKLLEFYKAILKVASKRCDFKQLVKPRKAECIWKSKNELSASDCCDSSDGDWDKKFKSIPIVKTIIKVNNEDDTKDEDEESIAMIKSKLHAEKANRYCQKCKIECPTDEVYTLHLKKVHSDSLQYSRSLQGSNRVCSPCQIEFPTKKLYSKHFQKAHSHFMTEEFKCETCNKTFKTQLQLTSHQDTHFPLKCIVCGKESANKRALSRHMETHGGEKKFQCDECGNRYLVKNSLNKHMLIHSDTRNFPCDECDKRFRNSSHLNRHKLTHSGLKPHVCPICNRKFAQKYNMRSHLKEHPSYSEYQPTRFVGGNKCKNCGQTFSEKELLIQHRTLGTCLLTENVGATQCDTIKLICNQYTTPG